MLSAYCSYFCLHLKDDTDHSIHSLYSRAFGYQGFSFLDNFKRIGINQTLDSKISKKSLLITKKLYNEIKTNLEIKYFDEKGIW